MRNDSVTWLFVVFGFLLLVYSIYTYSFTDPNLVLSSWPPFWSFQQWMWRTFFSNKLLLVSLYVALILAMFGVYIMLLRKLKKYENTLVQKRHVYIYGLLVGCLLFSYNALSHDVFNYIFNAKLFLIYQENPHVSTAIEHSADEWTRFMHNTHTPAPYGYGWTLLSLIPFMMGNQIFSLTWILFRIFELVAVFGLYASLQFLSRVLLRRELYLSELAVLFLNPLFLLEVISNMHNDLWMIVPAVTAVAVAVKYSRQLVKALLLAGVLLAVSISIKFATVLLVIPILGVLVHRTLLEKLLVTQLRRVPFSKFISRWITSAVEQRIAQWLPLICSVLLFIPLFMSRSQQFHPWYLVWSLSWIPLIKYKWWYWVLLIFSISALLRYVPWMWIDGFQTHTLTWQRVITWGLPALFFLVWLIWQNQQLRKNH